MVIGSTSIKHWFPDFPREPKDLDIIYTTKLSLYKESLYWQIFQISTINKLPN